MPCACTCAQVVHRHRARQGTCDSLICRPIHNSSALIHPMFVIVSLTAAVRRVQLRRLHCSFCDDRWSLAVCRAIPHPYLSAQHKNARQNVCLPPEHSLLSAHRACGARSDSRALSDGVCARVRRHRCPSLSGCPPPPPDPSTCKRTGFNRPRCGRERPSNAHPLSPHACYTRACVAS